MGPVTLPVKPAELARQVGLSRAGHTIQPPAQSPAHSELYTLIYLFNSTMWDTIVAYLSSDWATSPLKIDCIRSSILPLEMGNRPRGPSDFSNGKGRDSRYFSFSHNGAGMQRYTPCSFLMLTCNGNTLGPYLPHARVYGWPSN